MYRHRNIPDICTQTPSLGPFSGVLGPLTDLTKVCSPMHLEFHKHHIKTLHFTLQDPSWNQHKAGCGRQPYPAVSPASLIRELQAGHLVGLFILVCFFLCGCVSFGFFSSTKPPYYIGTNDLDLIIRQEKEKCEMKLKIIRPKPHIIKKDT